MVAKLSGPQKRRNSRPGRSLRFGLLISVIFLINLGWAEPSLTRIGFIGDILPDRGVKTVIRQEGADYLFHNAPDIFGDTGLICANLEAAVTDEPNRLVKTFRFNSPLNLGAYLYKYNIRAVNLANNHAVDYGRAGLRNTVANLTKYQITACGFGENATAALAARVIEYHGVKIALIGAVCFPLEGYVYLPEAYDVGRWDSSLIKAAICDAKAKADLVVINLHWGIEFSHYPTATQIKIGHFCIDQGADLVIGHHPHVLQGMEIYRFKPIFYSLGNFIFDQRYGPATESVYVSATIINKKLRQIAIAPVTIQNCIPSKASSSAATAIKANFSKYSQPFGLKAADHWELPE